LKIVAREGPILKVAIIGCGKIADSHAAQIRRVPDCEIVGVCDQEPLMAKQLFDRFPVKAHFDDVNRLLTEAQPDVVHITTPANSHFDLARVCLERGSHVYVEKPFTLTLMEAQTLIRLATDRRLKVTVGHDEQFSHVARRMRNLVRSGYLGGNPVHMESYYCYDLTDPIYAAAFLGDKHHWVRRLPGSLLQNIISHGIARIAEFLTTDDPTVTVVGFSSPALRRAGVTDVVDELRVIISEGERTTAYFTFSSQLRPSLHQFRIFGPNGGLFLDQDQETLIRLRSGRFKSHAEKFLPPVIFATQHLGNLVTNFRNFLANDFHAKAGMKYLIESFYRSIKEDSAPPVSYKEILLTAKIMDDIFQQLRSAERQQAASLVSMGQRGAK